MDKSRLNSVSPNALRWIARIWSLPIFAFVILKVFTPDPLITERVSLEDMFLLSLWGIAVLGLLIAWRWETAGAIITIGTMIFRELVWVVLKGGWMFNFLIIWVLVVPPAILFLFARKIEEKNLP